MLDPRPRLDSPVPVDLRQLGRGELERYRRRLLQEYLSTCIDRLLTRDGFSAALDLRAVLRDVDAERLRRGTKVAQDVV